MESALTVKGQATIPKAVRDHLRLGPGDRIRFFIYPDGSVAILPKIPTYDLTTGTPVHGATRPLAAPFAFSSNFVKPFAIPKMALAS
ncbi:MAG TPA: type II toxin-antitoxin system PrlF family antitoxin [Acidobacteriaceae bacterium]|nr:type II toxin-antitoxin system PrlF family antitoxin [Acidobacteriaceae bacterium]